LIRGERTYHARVAETMPCWGSNVCFAANHCQLYCENDNLIYVPRAIGRSLGLHVLVHSKAAVSTKQQVGLTTHVKWQSFNRTMSYDIWRLGTYKKNWKSVIDL
jgi:hypothetical protein